MITSATNARLKLARQLRDDRKTRERENLFIAEGETLCTDLINAGMQPQLLLVTEPYAGWAERIGLAQTVLISTSLMNGITDEMAAPGVLVVFKMPASLPAWEEVDATSSGGPARPPVLILDGLRDPGNLGACLRTAVGAGCRRVLLAPGTVDPWNPKVLRGGMGAHARLSLASIVWSEVGARIGGNQQSGAACRIVAASARGDVSYDQFDWHSTSPTYVILGSEASGLCGEALALATHHIRIPVDGDLESLNAAVACGVILFEAARQRRSGTV